MRPAFVGYHRETEPARATSEQAERVPARVRPGLVLWSLLLVLAASLAYGGGLDNPLFFDDSEAIVANESIRALGTALSPPAQTPVAGRPVVNLSFALNYAVSGLSPRSYRVLNLFLHVLDALLAWLLLRELLAREPVPARVREHAEGCARAISLLWLLHPLGSEARSRACSAPAARRRSCRRRSSCC